MIKSILIVGGGTAGWVTANLLNAKLNKNGNTKVKITLVESPNIPKIGVGEATVPNIRQTLYDIGLDEWEFMRATDATFKTMIRFPGWRKNSTYDHPFDRVQPHESALQVPAWLTQNNQTTNNNEFAEAFSLLTHISNAGLSPKTRDMESFQSPFPYAYHLDAIKFSHFLSKHGQANGIKHHLANITDVDVDERGHITKVHTDTENKFTADLYIDSTGFRSVLHKQKLKIKSKSFAKYLLCDSAVVMNVPYDVYRPERLNPFTTAKAMPSGWVWDIILSNRRGIGYVYSSAFETQDSAEACFRQDEGPHTKDIEAQHIKFKSQCSESAWFGNCVAIGLSGGFVEPLESSGIYLIEFAANTLCDLVPYVTENYAPFAKSYNRQIGLIYTEILEYLNIHYCLSNRDDSKFWREVTKPEHILPSLQDKLELWKSRPPRDADFDQRLSLFPVPSFEYILFGMGHKTNVHTNVTGSTPDLSVALKQSLSRLPTHDDLIASI